MTSLCSFPADGAGAAMTLRLAHRGDIPAIDALHFLSVQVLNAADYTAAQIEAFVGHLGTYDRGLIDAGTYFVMECEGQLVASGGWSRHMPGTQCSDVSAAQAAFTLSPDSVKIRSVFVHPHFARRGLGSRLVRHTEAEATAAGFRLLELWATLTGVPLYLSLGYQEVAQMAIPAGNGATVPAIHMAKLVPLSTAPASAA